MTKYFVGNRPEFIYRTKLVSFNEHKYENYQTEKSQNFKNAAVSSHTHVHS